MTDSEESKECIVCKDSLPLSCFYKRSDNGALKGSCKPCYNRQGADAKSKPEAKEKIREQRRRLRSLPHNRERGRKWAKKSHERYPEKTKARRAVRSAIEAGRMERPKTCQECGQEATRSDGVTAIHAHHEDYSKPLDVIWLCPICHSAAHRELDRALSEGGK